MSWDNATTTLVGVGLIQLIECDGNCVQILLVLGVLFLVHLMLSTGTKATLPALALFVSMGAFLL